MNVKKKLIGTLVSKGHAPMLLLYCLLLALYILSTNHHSVGEVANIIQSSLLPRIYPPTQFTLG